MSFIVGFFVQIVILFISATIFSFIVWKLKRGKTDFGEFVNKYGEMLAYAGLLFIALTIAFIKWWTD
jgi:hypothetical protein